MRVETGITPACAGKSSKIEGANVFLEDHPRVCGEKLSDSTDGLSKEGSPPRVRGKVLHFGTMGSQVRITPACAGKSRRAQRGPRGVVDHPRVCGEKARSAKSSRTICGSPPRVRGKAHHYQEIATAMRITPACAGKRPLSGMA